MDGWHKIQLQKRMNKHNSSRRKASSLLKGYSALSVLPNKGKLIHKLVLPLSCFGNECFFLKNITLGIATNYTKRDMYNQS